MSKRPTPKKKTAKSTTKKRYASFVLKAKKKITNKVNLTECSKCKAPVPVHTVCAECGSYKGEVRRGNASADQKITKISA